MKKLIDSINFPAMEKILFQGLKEYFYNFSKSYYYESVCIFALRIPDLMLDIDANELFYIVTEYSLQQSSKDTFLKSKKEGKTLRRIKIFKRLKSYQYHKAELLAPYFFTQWNKWKNQAYTLAEEKNIENILQQNLIKAFEKVINLAEHHKLFTIFYSINFFKVALIYNNDYIKLIKTSINTAQPKLPIYFSSMPRLPLARNPKLESMLFQNFHNKQIWLVYADWLQIQGDSRGEIIYLSIIYKTKYPKISLEMLDSFLQQRSLWPKADRSLLERLFILNQKKWCFLESELAEKFFRGVNLPFKIQWRLGFIYEIYFNDYLLGEAGLFLYKVLLSDAAIFLYKLSLDIGNDYFLGEKEAHKKYLDKLFSLRTYHSVRELHTNIYEDFPLDTILHFFPNLTQITYQYLGYGSKRLFYWKTNAYKIPKNTIFIDLVALELIVNTTFSNAEKLLQPKLFPKLSILKLYISYELFIQLNKLFIIHQIKTLYLFFVTEDNFEIIIESLTTWTNLKKVFINLSTEIIERKIKQNINFSIKTIY